MLEGVVLAMHPTSKKRQRKAKRRGALGTHDNLEAEVARHQAQFQARTSWDTLELGEEAEDDGEQHHEDSEQNRREDTLQDTNDRRRQMAEPGEPVVGFTEVRDIRDDTDERDYNLSSKASVKVRDQPHCYHIGVGESNSPGIAHTMIKPIVTP